MTTDQALADEIVGTIRQWVDRDVMPNASEFELSDTFPQAMFDQMCEFGLFGSTIAEEYGGLGLDIMTYTRIIEELSRGFMSLAGILNTHKIGATMIARFGTEEQKAVYLGQHQRRCHLVPDVLRARFRLRRGRSLLSGRPGRRRVDHHRPEGLDLLRAVRRLGVVSGPD